MTTLTRTQILLEKKQRDELMEIAKNEGKALSELVRIYLDAQLRQRKYQEMRLAAERLVKDYQPGYELTEMTVLDGEDFIHE